MIEINDVTVPTKGTGKYFRISALDFMVSPTNGINTYWQVFSQHTFEGELVPNVCILDGNLQMPQSVYDTWGTDDNVIIDWALTELGFTKVGV